nr:hydrogenase maturation protease [Halochromatium salexigens]
MRALVIGYGSPIRGDDALGPLVADQLETRVSADPELSAQVDVQARHILTAELVDDLARAERVIFIDAAANLPPGEVSRQRLAPDASALSTMAHFHDPRELLAWCQALYQRVPETWLVSAGGADWGYACYALSETAQTAVAPMIAEVLSLIGAEPDIPDTGP